MTTVLLIGFDPYRVPGVDAAEVAEALGRGRERAAEQGFDLHECLLGVDDSVVDDVVAALTARAWDCVVIGGGIRKPPPCLELFEEIVNLVRTHVPGASIAFNTSPENSADAVLRRLAAA